MKPGDEKLARAAEMLLLSFPTVRKLLLITLQSSESI